MSDMKCPFCKKELKLIGEKSDSGYPIDEYFCGCPQTAFLFGNAPMWNELRVLHDDLEERREYSKRAEKELIRTRKVLDKGMEHITGLNNMIESWYKLLQSDKDASTKYAILKSAISAYVENKGGDNE